LRVYRVLLMSAPPNRMYRYMEIVTMMLPVEN